MIAAASGAVKAQVPKPPKVMTMSSRPSLVCLAMERGTSAYHSMSWTFAMSLMAIPAYWI